jgi:hypothetical protein
MTDIAVGTRTVRVRLTMVERTDRSLPAVRSQLDAVDSLLLFAVMAEGGPSIWAARRDDGITSDALQREHLFSRAVGYYTDRYRSVLSERRRVWRILGCDIVFTNGARPTSIRLDPAGFAELEQLHLASPLWMILKSLPFVAASLTTIVDGYNRCRAQTTDTRTFVAQKMRTAAINVVREHLASKSANTAVSLAAEGVIADAARALRQIKSAQQLGPKTLADGCVARRGAGG